MGIGNTTLVATLVKANLELNLNMREAVISKVSVQSAQCTAQRCE